MTKTEAEQAILALPGVAAYRETQNDLRRSIRIVVTFTDGEFEHFSVPYKDPNSWVDLRDVALRHAKERDGCDCSPEELIGAPPAKAAEFVGAEYVCHKRVRAAKIKAYSLTSEEPRRACLVFEGDLPGLFVPLAELRGLEVGGYLVQYADGYRSFSPAKAFEEGYSRIAESAPPPTKTAWCEGCE